MPRLFGSSPSKESQRQQDDENRRRSFAFMKYTPERRTHSSMRRSREHAKQIAQLSEQSPTPFVEFQPFPVTTPPVKTPPAKLSPDSAYNMDVIPSSRSRQSQPVSLDAFVEEQQEDYSPPHGSVTSDSRSSKPERTVQSMPTFPSNSSMQSKNMHPSSASTVSGAAARRRMRAQKAGSRSDVGVNNDYEALEESAPVSPYPLTRSGSAKANHLIHYAQTRRAPIDVATPTSNRSINSGRSSQTSFSSADFGNVGFSFDAFGLDESQVEQEVNEALADLAQGSHPDLGFFLDDEFPVQNFDSSRGSTPTSEVDGFTDGFRVTVRQSPTSSERSSLTSTSEYMGADPSRAAGVNRFKVQAGFHKSKSQERRSESNNWANFDRSGRPPVSPGLPSSSPHYARSEPGGGPQPFPVIPNLVQEFPGESAADEESESDVGAAKSDVQAKSDAGAPSDVGVRSDVGVASDVGAKSDVALASDVGVASDFGGGDSDAAGAVPMEITGKKKKSSPQSVEEAEVLQVSNLKSKWERRQLEEAPQRVERLERRKVTTSPLPREEIARLENKLGDELLSPEILEKKQMGGTPRVSTLKAVRTQSDPEQKRRAAECAKQRTSFASYRERLKPAHLRSDDKKNLSSAQSDFAGYNMPLPEMNAVLNKFNRQKPFGSQDSDRETKSDVGGAPAFLTNVKLRSTGGVAKYADQRRQQDDSPYNSRSSFEFDDSGSLFDDHYDEEGSFYSDEELEWMREQEQEFDSESSEEPKPRKMTYREKRELELKAERERKQAEEKAKKQPERDVAALIRRRIAANKRMAAKAEKEKSEPKEDISDMRNRLRKVTVEENASPRPSPMGPKVNVDKSSGFSAEQFRKTPPRDVSTEQSIPPVKPQELNVVEARSSWSEPAPTESTSPNQHPPSMASTEVDSSSTSRSFPEPSSTSNLNRQPASEIPMEREDQLEGDRHEPSQEVEVKKAQAPPAASPAAPAAVEEASISASSKSTKSVLNALFGKRKPPPPSNAAPTKAHVEDDNAALMKMKEQKDTRKVEEATPSITFAPAQLLQAEPSPSARSVGSHPALKDDPKYDRYFRMLKVGMPMDVVKHAMTRDGMDPGVMDGDPNQPAGGVSLKEDPKYARYFKMLAVGLPMGAVKNAMERDGLDPSIMDQDHNLPAGAEATTSKGTEPDEVRPKDTHRRTRVHWETLRQVRASSLWAKIDNDPELEQIDIDEEEFAQLFQAELTPSQTMTGRAGALGKRGGAAVRVIESKRANNGGIILARLKMTHDDMADAVDRIDENDLTAEQMQNIIEYLPTKEERKALEEYMLEGGQDAAEKFDGLCECEKFMVAMMTVKHAKRKVRALLFKLQFDNCLESLEKDTNLVETACDELSNSVRLRKLLGIVLNIGNRLNTAGATGKRKAGAFSLNSLLKLSHAKAFDRKTTFLHYVILVVQRNNELLLNFKDDIPTALKADKVYWDQCLNDLEEVENQLENVRRIALYHARLAQIYRLQKKKPKSEDDDESLSDESMTLEEEVEALRSSSIGLFTLGAIKKVSALRDKVESTKVKFKKLLEYFGEDDKHDRMQPHELFNVMATFCRDFDKAKEQVLAEEKKKKREERKRQASSKAMNGNGKKSPPRLGDLASPMSASKVQSNRSSIKMERAPHPSPKSDAGVNYLPSGRVREPQPSQKSRVSDYNPMQQHPSTVNGMYETPKQPPSRTPRSSVRGDRESALRQKARMRRRMAQGRSSKSSASSSTASQRLSSSDKMMPQHSSVHQQQQTSNHSGSDWPEDDWPQGFG